MTEWMMNRVADPTYTLRVSGMVVQTGLSQKEVDVQIKVVDAMTVYGLPPLRIDVVKEVNNEKPYQNRAHEAPRSTTQTN